MNCYKGKFIVQKQEKKNIGKIKPIMSKPQFFVEIKDKNKEKKFHNEDDSFTIENEDENPNNINNNVYNFDFNLRDKN